MSAAFRVSDLRYVPSHPHEQAAGLLGYIGCTVNGLLRLDNLMLRRTLDGRTVLSFPARTDRAGRRHAYFRPVDDAASQVIAAAVFEALGLRKGQAA